MDTEMIMACVLARLQAQGQTLGDLAPGDMQKLIDDAIADLGLAEEIVGTSPAADG